MCLRLAWAHGGGDGCDGGGGWGVECHVDDAFGLEDGHHDVEHPQEHKHQAADDFRDFRATELGPDGGHHSPQDEGSDGDAGADWVDDDAEAQAAGRDYELFTLKTKVWWILKNNGTQWGYGFMPVELFTVHWMH